MLEGTVGGGELGEKEEWYPALVTPLPAQVGSQTPSFLYDRWLRDNLTLAFMGVLDK